nr:MAG TPA: hypothetical protein [Caudoviricetes sp.]
MTLIRLKITRSNKIGVPFIGYPLLCLHYFLKMYLTD